MSKSGTKTAALVFGYWTVAVVMALWLMKTESATVNWWALSVFAFSAWLADRIFVHVADSVKVSASDAIMFAALIVLGPLGGGITAAATALDAQHMGNLREKHLKILFNVPQLFLSFGLAGFVYVKLGGAVGLIDAATFPSEIIPLACAALTAYVVNCVSLAWVICAHDDVAFGEAVPDMFRSVSLPSHAAVAVLGILLSQMFWLLGALGLALLAIPLVISNQAYSAYVSRRTAYVDSVTALVGAIEAKDPYTRGHSERVSGMAARTAVAMRLPPVEVDRVRMAGLLHDIGKVAVNTVILRKPAALSAEEYELIKLHPEMGEGIVGNIELLKGAIDGIKFHHEHVDGTGYLGLRGDAVPLPAKILGVADAYDSMTSRRHYRAARSREAAISELRRCAGTQFDPEVVESFVGSLETADV